jgi:hypothetical protein
MNLKMIHRLGFITVIAALSLGCSKIDFSGKHSTSLASEIMPGQDTHIQTSQISTSISYPSYAKVSQLPLQHEQTEIFVNTQADQQTCLITAFVSPIEANLCNEVPDLCWTHQIATVSKTSDYTCHQAYRAEGLLYARLGTACTPITQMLSPTELAQINDPQQYAILTSNIDNSGLMPDPATTLPTLNSISLDKYCRCSYTSSDQLGFQYSYPALESHCDAHFNDVY